MTTRDEIRSGVQWADCKSFPPGMAWMVSNDLACFYHIDFASPERWISRDGWREGARTFGNWTKIFHLLKVIRSVGWHSGGGMSALSLHPKSAVNFVLQLDLSLPAGGGKGWKSFFFFFTYRRRGRSTENHKFKSNSILETRQFIFFLCTLVTKSGYLCCSFSFGLGWDGRTFFFLFCLWIKVKARFGKQKVGKSQWSFYCLGSSSFTFVAGWNSGCLVERLRYDNVWTLFLNLNE